MDYDQKAAVAAAYEELSRFDARHPEQLAEAMLERASKLVEHLGLSQEAGSQEQATAPGGPGEPSAPKLEVAEYGESGALQKASEYPNYAEMDLEGLTERQARLVETLNALVSLMERQGFQRPQQQQEGWMSRTLANYQRGYLERDIFTEAVTGLVWMAAKAVHVAVSGSRENKLQGMQTEMKALLSQLKVELAQEAVNVRREQRHLKMGQALDQAVKMRQAGRGVEADRHIVNTFDQLLKQARQDRDVYSPRDRHAPLIGQAAERLRAYERGQQQPETRQGQERRKDKGRALGL